MSFVFTQREGQLYSSVSLVFVLCVFFRIFSGLNAMTDCSIVVVFKGYTFPSSFLDCFFM